MKPEEPEFMLDKNGYITRRYWDNVFCFCCGTELTPNESYGESIKEPGICLGCGHIIMDEILKEIESEKIMKGIKDEQYSSPQRLLCNRNNGMGSSKTIT